MLCPVSSQFFSPILLAKKHCFFFALFSSLQQLFFPFSHLLVCRTLTFFFWKLLQLCLRCCVVLAASFLHSSVLPPKAKRIEGPARLYCPLPPEKFTAHNVQGDGRCGYRAIARYLGVSNGGPQRAKTDQPDPQLIKHNRDKNRTLSINIEMWKMWFKHKNDLHPETIATIRFQTRTGSFARYCNEIQKFCF